MMFRQQLYSSARKLARSLPLASLHRAAYGAIRGEPHRTLFVFGHVRCGSTLLVHLLDTSPEVFGYGETFITYRHERDLARLPVDVEFVSWRLLGRRVRYVLDKLLHNHLLASPEILRAERVRAIFMLREPRAAFSSMIQAPKLPGWPQASWWNRDHVDQQRLLDYYRQRLEHLVDYARVIDSPERAVFLTFEELLDRTQDVFQLVCDALSLESEFSECYELLSTSGRAGPGDPSKHIRSGRIVRERGGSQLEIAPELLTQVEAAHSAAEAALRSLCRNLEEDKDSCS